MYDSRLRITAANALKHRWFQTNVNGNASFSSNAASTPDYATIANNSANNSANTSANASANSENTPMSYLDEDSNTTTISSMSSSTTSSTGTRRSVHGNERHDSNDTTVVLSYNQEAEVSEEVSNDNMEQQQRGVKRPKDANEMVNSKTTRPRRSCRVAKL